MSYFLQHKQNNLWHGKFSLFPENIAVHAISTRQAGVSQKPYDFLNLAFHVGDDAAAVRENRAIFANSLEMKAEDIVSPQQVHGDRIMRVTAAHLGMGAMDYESAIRETDALITNEPGLPLMLCFADCTPVLFLDPEHKAVGIAHAGWKGTLCKIGRKTLEAMHKEFGTEPSECLAGIGPSIGPCCYEIGDEIVDACQKAFPRNAEKLLIEKDDRMHLNLWAANRLQLMEAGMLPENIDSADTCTSCEHHWYFSYRADGGTTGRIAAMIALRKY